jgi:AcrR family transcriptional regulator
MQSEMKQQPLQRPGRRERRRNETRERIFRAAITLFAKNGFSETTTEQITEAADVGQGTFFNYFPTKPHVLTVLTEIQLKKIAIAKLEADEGRLSIHEVLYRLVFSITEEVGRSSELTRALITAFLSNEEVRMLTGKTMAQGREELTKVLATGQCRGEIRRDLKPAHLALTFQRDVVGSMLLWAIGGKGGLRDWLEKAFRDFWEIAEVKRG